jgi:tetratricopeptide (TPR) repeat protein
VIFQLAPEGQVVVYLLQFLVIAAGCGALTLHLPRALPMPRITRFLFGFTLAPYAIGAGTAILGSIIPGGPGWLFYWLPAVGAVVLLAVFGRRTGRRFVRTVRRGLRAAAPPWLVLGIASLAVIVVGAGTGPRLWANAWTPVSGHDALLYSSKAAVFAEQRATAAIAGMRGSPEGTAREDAHGILYPAFLGHAMLTAPGAHDAWPANDYALRFAFQVSFPLMLLAVAALGATYRLPGTGALAITLLLMVGYFEYISFQSSRDAFRIIPLMLYTALLVGLSPARLRARVHPSVAAPLFLLPIAVLYGHTLGGIVAVLATAAWMVSVLLQRAPWLKVFLLLCIIGLGFVFGAIRYFELYLHDGMIQGYASVEASVAGTALAAIREANRQTLAQTGLWARLALPFTTDAFRLSLPGILAAFASLAWWWKKRHERNTFVFLLLSLTTMLIFLPLTGLLDYSGYRISAAFVRNLRYTLHWYPYAAVSLAGLLMAWQHSTSQATGDAGHRVTHRLATGVVAAIAVAAAATALLVIQTDWRVRSETFVASADEVGGPIKMMLKQLAPGEHWLLDDDRYNYNLGNEGRVMYTRATWPVIKAQTLTEAQVALDTLGIRAVALLRADIPGWWTELPFFALLNDPKKAVVLSGDYYVVYDRIKDQADYGRRLASYLAAEDVGGPAALHSAQLTSALGTQDASRVLTVTLTPEVELVLPDVQYAAASLMAAASEQPQDYRIQMALGHIYTLLGSPVPAYAAYRQARESGADPQEVTPYMAAARSLQAEQLAAMGQYELALRALTAAAALAPTDPLVINRLLAAHRIWGSNLEHGLLAEVVGQLTQVIRAGGATPEVYLALAEVYNELQQAEQAAAVYDQVLERWAKDVAILQRVAATAAATHHWETAAEAYRQMIRTNPDAQKPYEALAEIYLAQLKPDQARALLEQAAHANPGAAWPHLALGRLYQQLSQQP